MNIHLITYLTSKLFWIYTVFRYNTILYPKNEDTQIIALFSAGAGTVFGLLIQAL